MITRLFLLLIAAISSAMPSSAQNVTVNYNAGSGAPIVVGPDGVTPVANGNVVEIGYFSNFDVGANANNLSALATARQSGHWHVFGSTTITSSFILPPGSFAGSSSQPDSAGFSGNPIDLWIFQTPNAAPPATDLSNVTAWGLFSSTLNNGPQQTWIFPPASIFQVDNITSSDIDAVSGIFYHGQLKGGNLQLAPATTSASRPRLTITPAGSNILLSWPTNSSSFFLQDSTNLASGGWITTTLQQPPTVVSGQFVATIPQNTTQHYYRLKQ